uniref:WD repeat-containing protein 90-like n=1 Tax=Myxine glutinosa TaxID=7769 RepID=UPI00358F6724
MSNLLASATSANQATVSFQVIALAVSLDGGALASTSSYGNLHVWDLQEMELLVQFHVQKQDCRCIAWSPQHGGDSRWLAGGYTDGTFRLFALPDAHVLLKMRPHVCTINQLVFSWNGEILLSGDVTGRIAVSSVLTRTTLRVIGEHAGSELRSLQCIAAKLCGERWLATSADGLVTVWSANWERKRFLLEHSLTLPAQFKAGGRKDVSGTGDTHGVALLGGSDSDSLLWAGGAGHRVLLSYHLSGKKTSQVTSLSSALTCLAVSTDGHFVAIGTQGRSLRLVDVNTGYFRDAVSHSDGINAASFSRSGKLLATAAGNEILLWTP